MHSSIFLFASLALTSASELCDLAEKNISLSSLSQPYYQGYGTILDSSVRIYISLCKPLSNLPSNVSTFCDKTAFSCVTKIDERGTEVEYIRNGGSNSTGLKPDASHYAVQLHSGSQCSTNDNRTVSTRISFFCTNNIENDNAIHYEGVLGECSHQLFWFSSLVCQEGQQTRPTATSCVIKVPGYDAIIDVGMWASDAYYTARSAGDGEDGAVYHLNLCKTIKGDSPCPNNSILCQVDKNQTEMLDNLLNYTAGHTLSYAEEKEVISLHYPRESGGSVNIRIECDRAAAQPVISMVHKDTHRTVFRMMTASACLVPPVQCVAQDNQGNLYDLSSLKAVEWEIGVASEKNARYQIKVCGSLPISPENPCSGQAGICTYRFAENTTQMVEAHNLGIMYKRPVITEDGDISLEYSHGKLYQDDRGNSCNMSAEIILKCSEGEMGPRFEEATACRHTFVWSTPDACPRKKVVSKDCTVREPLFSNLFNISSLYNTTADYRLQGAAQEYILNVCGPLLTTCKENETCLRNEKTLTYLDGALEMVYSSPSCSSETNETLTARIVFECNHDVAVGSPVLVSEEGCQVELEWETNLACPPHETVQCSIPTKEGLIDLSELSLPHDNYLVESSDNKFYMNLCRSLVHNNKSRCPYQSAVCLLDPAGAADVNLGEVHSGIKLNTEGRPYITYTLGSMCKDNNSSLGHMQTTIYFSCEPDRFESEPEYLEWADCHYIFEWKHAAACPVKTSSGNCSVTSPESGFTFDLSSLQKPGGWRWNETSHHFNNHLDMNVCGPLEDSPCGAGSGVCDNGKANLGLANSNLTFTEGQLMLVYPGGECPGQKDLVAETRIRFVCPPRRMLSSGNVERDGPKKLKVIKAKDTCYVILDFYTDLACDHQVYCDVMRGDAILPLTKLRRHDRNYRVTNKDEEGFYLNICGPLVPTDVPMSACNPQGVCGYFDGRYVGMGKVLTSPRVVANGHVELSYEDGDLCSEDHGRTWSSKIFFTCNKDIDELRPFGVPSLVSVDNRTCESVFHVSTVLACNDTTKDFKLTQPDPCRLYHPGKEKYVSLEGLHGDQPYKVVDPSSATSEEYYEIQPCGTLVPSCKGSICKITQYQNFSLGTLNDVMYYPETDELRVRYIEGDVCNSINNRKFAAKIYYSCDPSVAGAGAPTLVKDGVLDCLAMFNWGSRLLCDQTEIDVYIKNNGKTVDVDLSSTTDPSASSIRELKKPDSGGISWTHVGFVLMLVVVIAGTVYVYRNPAARERVKRMGQEMRARMPVNLGGRSRSDSTLLVSGLNSGGSLDEDDEFYS